MNKKLLITAITALALATAAFAQTENDFQVGLTSDNEGVVIIRYLGKAAQVRIPATIQDMLVREIGNSAFAHNETITSVIIPQGVTKIGRSAFYFDGFSSPKLASVTIPEGVIEIGDYAFRNAPLTSLTLPQSLTTIGENAFENTNITEITLPATLTRIGESAFNGCRRLRTVTFPEGMTEIPGRWISGKTGMFQSCTALTTINFPSTLIRIGDKAFVECRALTAITLPDSIKEIGYEAFLGCTELTTVTIPESVESIRIYSDGSIHNAFFGCPKLSLASQLALKRVGYTGF